MMRNQKIIAVSGVVGALLLSATFVVAANDRLDELRARAEQRTEQLRNRIEQMKNQAKDQAIEKRQKIEQRISQFKDRSKKDTATNIAGRFEIVNGNAIEHFTDVLDRLDVVLQKIQSKADQVSVSGDDISSVITAIQNAETKIAAARESVAKQAEKTYVVDITKVTDSTTSTSPEAQKKMLQDFREQFVNMKNQLYSDISAIRHGTLVEAREAVLDAFEALKTLPNATK